MYIFRNVWWDFFPIWLINLSIIYLYIYQLSSRLWLRSEIKRQQIYLTDFMKVLIKRATEWAFCLNCLIKFVINFVVYLTIYTCIKKIIILICSEIDVIMPGYTHLQVRQQDKETHKHSESWHYGIQHFYNYVSWWFWIQRAQPIRWSHWLLR